MDRDAPAVASKPDTRPMVPGGPATLAEGLDGVRDRLRSAEGVGLTHNAWRTAYAKDVAWLLKELEARHG